MWAAAILLVVASFQFPPTQYVWHGLAVPNGNPYREAFVFSGMVVIVAWLALAHRPRVLHLALAAALLVTATFVLRHTDDFGGWTWPAVLGGGALSLLALVLLTLGEKRRVLLPVAAVLMIGVVFAESTVAAANADARRARERWAKPAATSNQSITHHFEAVRGVDGWPAYRTDSGAPQTSYNDALALQAEGPQYYSSYLPEVTYQALEPLGYGFKNDGRTFFGADNPVLDAIFSIGARVRPGDAPHTWTGSKFPAPPLVTVRSAPYASPNPADSVYARQETVLGATLYAVPPVRRAGTATEQTYAAQCRPGSEAYWYSPELYGSSPPPAPPRSRRAATPSKPPSPEAPPARPSSRRPPSRAGSARPPCGTSTASSPSSSRPEPKRSPAPSPRRASPRASPPPPSPSSPSPRSR
ncbi:YfhO family protein [Streptomyces sp. NPDC003042]